MEETGDCVVGKDKRVVVDSRAVEASMAVEPAAAARMVEPAAEVRMVEPAAGARTEAHPVAMRAEC